LGRPGLGPFLLVIRLLGRSWAYGPGPFDDASLFAYDFPLTRFTGRQSCPAGSEAGLFFPFHCWPGIPPKAKPGLKQAETSRKWQKEDSGEGISHPGTPPWYPLGYTRASYSLPVYSASTSWSTCGHRLLSVNSSVRDINPDSLSRKKRGLFHPENKPFRPGKPARNGKETRHRKHSCTRTTRKC